MRWGGGGRELVVVGAVRRRAARVSITSAASAQHAVSARLATYKLSALRSLCSKGGRQPDGAPNTLRSPMSNVWPLISCVSSCSVLPYSSRRRRVRAGSHGHERLPLAGISRVPTRCLGQRPGLVARLLPWLPAHGADISRLWRRPRAATTTANAHPRPCKQITHATHACRATLEVLPSSPAQPSAPCHPPPGMWPAPPSAA